jgi:hypothetical protein
VDIDTSNDQLVGVQGDIIAVLFPNHRMSKPEALRHTAWLVALADDRGEFADVLAAVQNT